MYNKIKINVLILQWIKIQIKIKKNENVQTYNLYQHF